MKQQVIYIGVGGFVISNDRSHILKTCALGSCVAVLIYDFKLNTAGLMHIALPDSRIDPEKSKKIPGYYVDTGLPLLIEGMKNLGAVKKNVWIKIVGGARTFDKNMEFDIGERNVKAVKEYLRKNAVGPLEEDIGGSKGKTVSITVESGTVTVSSGGKKWHI